MYVLEFSHMSGSGRWCSFFEKPHFCKSLIQIHSNFLTFNCIKKYLFRNCGFPFWPQWSQWVWSAVKNYSYLTLHWVTDWRKIVKTTNWERVDSKVGCGKHTLQSPDLSNIQHFLLLNGDHKIAPCLRVTLIPNTLYFDPLFSML